jgi:rubrerythrin
MKKLAEKNRALVIDLLGERLAFERESVRLYDAVLEKMGRLAEEEVASMLEQTLLHREQEKQHAALLEQHIRELGGDAGARTELARLTERESQGIAQVILDPAEPLPHLLHALLAAELVDNAGWDLLVELADEAGDREARRTFKRCLREEEDHLIFVRESLERLARRELLAGEARA